MNYFSTNSQSASVDFKTAAIQGQAPDKGLYFPEHIPALPSDFFDRMDEMSNEEIAFRVMKPYVGDCIPDDVLQAMVNQTIAFPIPLVPINAQVDSLELFHGPTLAFKDVGARFMSRCLGYFLKDSSKKVTVLVATSGDTGGAVAHGFYDVPGVEVVILYPSGKVSQVQEKQLTGLGKNIHALEVKGSFDDCQQMVKDIFATATSLPHLFLTSANSINVARWLPQQMYYFLGYKQSLHKDAVVAVPSGNFGNLCAGMLAAASGLPIPHFIAACNANDVVPRFLQTGIYHTQASVPTISNAMDVANPSNWVRILELFEQNIPALKNKLSAYSTSDAETRATIKQVYALQGYLLDPHGAVAYAALEKYFRTHPHAHGWLIETAHPVKFFDVVAPIINAPVPLPPAVAEQMKQPKQALLMDNNTEALRQYLREQL